MDNLTPSTENFDPVYQRIRDILVKARHRALQVVNAEMVRAYWEIGREIVEEELQAEIQRERELLEQEQRLRIEDAGRT